MCTSYRQAYRRVYSYQADRHSRSQAQGEVLLRQYCCLCVPALQCTTPYMYVTVCAAMPWGTLSTLISPCEPSCRAFMRACGRVDALLALLPVACGPCVRAIVCVQPCVHAAVCVCGHMCALSGLLYKRLMGYALWAMSHAPF